MAFDRHNIIVWFRVIRRCVGPLRPVRIPAGLRNRREMVESGKSKSNSSSSSGNSYVMRYCTL